MPQERLSLAPPQLPPRFIEFDTAGGRVLLQTDEVCMLTMPLAKLTAEQP